MAIDEGDFITMIGSNGAGKSTLMQIIAGSTLPDHGVISIDGKNITQQTDYQRAKWIGRVFQDPMKGTAASLTVEENLALAMTRRQRRGLNRAVKTRYLERFRDHLAKLHLGLETRLSDPIGLLSGGQRQSITLLMAALVQPRIIILDEHTAALDPKTARTVMALTKELIESEGLTAVMITHNMEHAVTYGNRIIMLHKGQIAFDLRGNEREQETATSLFSRFTKVCAE